MTKRKANFDRIAHIGFETDEHTKHRLRHIAKALGRSMSSHLDVLVRDHVRAFIRLQENLAHENAVEHDAEYDADGNVIPDMDPAA